MSSIHHRSRSSTITDNPRINPTFYQLLQMTPDELDAWIDDVRACVLNVWNDDSFPPFYGSSVGEIADQFWELRNYDTSELQCTDELDGEHNVILNPRSALVACVNQFFPGMLKTRINYGHNGIGYSVYDLFADDRFRIICQMRFRRHFREDSFYAYSGSLDRNHSLVPDGCSSGIEWIRYCNAHPESFESYSFWLSEQEPRQSKGTGYTQIDSSTFLSLSGKEVWTALGEGDLSVTHLPNQLYEPNDSKQYHIRLYKKSTRIFPMGFNAFRIGYAQVAANFHPLIAKFLYEKYAGDLWDQDVIAIYDSSAGWGGRIVGAMATEIRSPEGQCHIHYVGTDPNTANWIPELGKSRYESVAAMLLQTTGEHSTHSYRLFQECSEDIHKHREFRRYRGKVDFVLSSPPYFCKELYSDDEYQSANRYPDYEDWRDSFLVPTLATCVEWLRPNRYLAWNVANIKLDGDEIPLEEDSQRILEDLGMEFIGIEKMVISSMSGANRTDEHGQPTTKNFCIVNGKPRKMEPIFVWYKPQTNFSTRKGI
jgi:hypothetical protein